MTNSSNSAPPKPKSRSNNSKSQQSSYTSDKAEIDSLHIQISFSKAKTADLENQLKEKENSLKIYQERIKILETQRSDNLREEYFPNPQCPSTFQPHASLDCPCKVQSNSSELIFSVEIKDIVCRIVWFITSAIDLA